VELPYFREACVACNHRQTPRNQVESGRESGLASFLMSWPTRSLSRLQKMQLVCYMRPVQKNCLVLLNVSAAVAARLAVPSTCVPPGAVMLSTVNGYHASLRQAAFERVRTQRCFMDRVVSVCFNVSDAIGLCLNAPPVPPAQFRSGPYASLLWAKWYFIADALLVAHTTLWIDSDVVLLQNPWAALVPQRQDPHVAPYHIQFQAERPISNPRWLRGEQMCLPVASSGINGGLLLVRSAALAHSTRTTFVSYWLLRTTRTARCQQPSTRTFGRSGRHGARGRALGRGVGITLQLRNGSRLRSRSFSPASC
jgi:hypothetical protein